MATPLTVLKWDPPFPLLSELLPLWLCGCLFPIGLCTKYCELSNCKLQS